MKNIITALAASAFIAAAPAAVAEDWTTCETFVPPFDVEALAAESEEIRVALNARFAASQDIAERHSIVHEFRLLEQRILRQISELSTAFQEQCMAGL